MPEFLRSLLVILFIAFIIFKVAKRPITIAGMSSNDFDTRRRLWFAITIIAFLANNFWIFIVIAIPVFLYAAKRDQNKIALVFFLLFAVPLFGAEITGFGLVNFLFELNYFRLLSLLILLPTYFSLRASRQNEANPKYAADYLLFAYIALGLFRQFQIDSATNTARTLFYIILDIFLPYYVASRSIKDLKSFADVFSAFTISAILIGAIGLFELLKGWLLYSSLNETFGIDWGYGKYLDRAGTLRAIASTGQPIVLGYVLAVAFGFYLYLNQKLPSKTTRAICLTGLVFGIVAPLSRGPWVGVFAAGLLFIATGDKPLKTILHISLPALFIFMVLLTTPYGATIIDHLPFVGTVDIENVTFREKLFDNSLQVISRNPYFGSFDYILSPELEELRSGGDDGIIDIVNTYLAITLSSGIVGLTLFVTFFMSVLVQVSRATRKSLAISKDIHLLGRTLLSTLVGILVIIYTVSSITFIPIIYWMVAGLGVSYVRLVTKGISLSNSNDVIY
jgi:hypothetical protein